ncbi:MAG: DUF4174 domain-containing protein [Janthinobacterium lividum]
MSSQLLLAAIAVWAALPAGPARAAGDSLQVYRWKSRVVLALAPSAADPALRDQRRIFRDFGAEARQRDLVLVEATDDTPQGAALRRRFGGSGFRAVLIGKDGGEKLTSGAPLRRDDLFPVIDAMPMRQEEMIRRP